MAAMADRIERLESAAQVGEPEATVQHIARDIREGRFPKKSPAQVGEPTVDAGLIANIAVAEKEKRDIAVAEMKERCAQVALNAELTDERHAIKVRQQIAAAIRELGDTL
jgi:hypothetical protein